MNDYLSRRNARPGIMTGYSFSIQEYHANAIKAAESAESDGTRPTLEVAMLEWFVAEEAKLGIPACTPDENGDDLRSLSTEIEPDPAFKNRIHFRFSDHLSRRLHDITVRKSNAVTRELRNCLEYAAAELAIRNSPSDDPGLLGL